MIRSEGPFTARNGRSGQKPIVAYETRKMRPQQGYTLPFLYIHQLLPAITHKQKFSITAQLSKASGTSLRSDLAAAKIC
jgi:hypothetical protein